MKAVVPQTDGVSDSESGNGACSKHHRGTTMDYYAGIDVSLEQSSLCVVDVSGKIIREAKVASEPQVLIEWFVAIGFPMARIGLEAGPLSQWLFAAMRKACLAVELVETRHVRTASRRCR
jgi:transposase